MSFKLQLLSSLHFNLKGIPSEFDGLNYARFNNFQDNYNSIKVLNNVDGLYA